MPANPLPFRRAALRVFRSPLQGSVLLLFFFDFSPFCVLPPCAVAISFHRLPVLCSSSLLIAGPPLSFTRLHLVFLVLPCVFTEPCRCIWMPASCAFIWSTLPHLLFFSSSIYAVVVLFCVPCDVAAHFLSYSTSIFEAPLSLLPPFCLLSCPLA